jgi:phage terminase Nu1 subunit (DNA packaging protein)
MKSKPLDKTQVAAHFNVSRNTVSDWQLRGLPFKRNGRRLEFDLGVVLEWLERRNDGNGDRSEFRKAREVRMVFQARLAHLQFQREIAESVKTADVKGVSERIFKTVRSHLLKFPDRIVEVLTGERKRTPDLDARRICKLMEEEIRKTLGSICDALVKEREAVQGPSDITSPSRRPAQA